MGAQKIRMRLFLLLTTLMLAACAMTPQAPEKAQPHPVFPPPPDEPRFVYERSLYTSADVLQDSDIDTFRRFVTGEKKAGEAFSKPYGVAVHQGRVYVSDSVRRVVFMFDLPGKRFAQIGSDDPGSLRLPLGLDVDANGNLYVCDATTKYVQIYDASGKYLRQLAGSDWLRRPSGLAVTPSGDRVYVVDTGGVDNQDHRVRVFDGATGKHLLDFGSRGDGPGELNLPRDIAVAPDGTLFVVDGGNFRVQVFDPSGKFLRTFGSVGRQGGQFSRPKEIAVDRTGNVYVVDTAFGNFQIFNPAGQLLLYVGARSNADGPAKYMLPSGIAVDDDGRIYVVDQFFRKVDIYRPAADELTNSRSIQRDGLEKKLPSNQ